MFSSKLLNGVTKAGTSAFLSFIFGCRSVKIFKLVGITLVVNKHFHAICGAGANTNFSHDGQTITAWSPKFTHSQTIIQTDISNFVQMFIDKYQVSKSTNGRKQQWIESGTDRTVDRQWSSGQKVKLAISASEIIFSVAHYNKF